MNIIDYLRNNWFEITSAVLSIIYLVFSIRQHILLWFFGLISSLFYCVVFLDTKLYADMSLQLYYAVVSIYGWYHWTFGKSSDQSVLKASRMTLKQLLEISLATVGIYVLYYVILKYATDSPIPALDSVVGALSITGTWMLARKHIENWIVWIVVDGLCIGLYLWKHLYPTTILFVIYTIMSFIGYFQWRNSMKNNSSETESQKPLSDNSK